VSWAGTDLDVGAWVGDFRLPRAWLDAAGFMTFSRGSRPVPAWGPSTDPRIVGLWMLHCENPLDLAQGRRECPEALAARQEAGAAAQHAQ
jgi:hypothetical protein